MEDIESPKCESPLSAAEIRSLVPVLKILQERRDQVVSHIYGLYLTHFDEDRRLSEADFRDLYERELDTMMHRLSARDRAEASPAPAGVPTMEEAERDLIRKALETTGGNKLQAARLMRISRHRLYDKLRKFGIDHRAAY